jgi:hypothetical protein
VLPPDQLVWCGVDSVLLYWEETLLMVGPYGDSIKFPYDEPVVLIPECDGVRILSNTYMEFLQRVPDSTVSIFKIGSTSPAAMLYDALEQFDKRSAKVIVVMNGRKITCSYKLICSKGADYYFWTLSCSICLNQLAYPLSATF